MKIDRNKLCGCNSDKKHKHCCGRREKKNTTTVNEMLEDVKLELGHDEYEYQRSIILNETIVADKKTPLGMITHRMSGKDICTDVQRMKLGHMRMEAV